jgi:hypothetical protein
MSLGLYRVGKRANNYQAGKRNVEKKPESNEISKPLLPIKGRTFQGKDFNSNFRNYANHQNSGGNGRHSGRNAASNSSYKA